MFTLRFFGPRLFRSYTDAFNFYARQFATMPHRSVIPLAPFVFERNNLFVFALFQNFSRDFGPGYGGAPVGHVSPVGKHQNLAKSRRLAGIDIQKIDINRIAFRDTKLSATGLDNCVSHKPRKKPPNVPQMGLFDKRKPCSLYGSILID